MTQTASPVRPADDDARALALRLMLETKSATLATLDGSGHPSASRKRPALLPCRG